MQESILHNSACLLWEEKSTVDKTVGQDIAFVNGMDAIPLTRDTNVTSNIRRNS